MKLNILLPAAAALMLTSGTAIAADQQTRSSNGAEAGRQGASAGAEWRQKSAQRDDRRSDRRERRGSRGQMNEPGSASTYGSGAVHTERRRSSAAVTSGGRASGPGSNSATSTVDAYGETTRDGSSADIYGDSTANADERRRRDDPRN